MNNVIFREGNVFTLVFLGLEIYETKVRNVMLHKFLPKI